MKPPSTIPILKGKVAIVTGGSRGIGRGIALRLAADGADVAISYRTDKHAADETLEALLALGGQAIAVKADMADISQIRGLFERTQERFGHLDILVNNAGISRIVSIADTTESDYDELFAINTKGVFFAMQEAARRLAGNGRIVNISSGITILGSAGGGAYAGTKGAVELFTMVAAKELGSRGITVNTVSPGITDTALLQQVMPTEIQRQMAESSVFKRLGRPDDIADVVAFLVSENGRWVTGQNIRATGGSA